MVLAKRTHITIVFFIFFCWFFLSKKAFSAFSLIRDAQTEKFLDDLSVPIIKYSGLNEDAIKIYIVNDSSLNAFVTGGQNIFIHTGLIRKFDKPNALIGVFAHEIGHIIGGHIARSGEHLEKAGNTMLLSYLLGLTAAIAGSPQAAQGIILGGSNIAEKSFLKYNRGQEEAADRYALQILQRINYPPSGLVDLLQYFEKQTIGLKGKINEYALTHPVSEKRIGYLINNINFEGSEKLINQKLQPQLAIVQAKLEAFIDDSSIVLRKYRFKNDEISNYAKSIALFRLGKIDSSLKILNEIISKSPSDGFLPELKAQILYESGLVKDSILEYKKAIKLISKYEGEKYSSQAKIHFAAAILTLKSDQELTKIAVKNLQEALKYEKQNPFLYKNLASAYNRLGQDGKSFLALAEQNILISQSDKALKYAKIAKEKFEEDKKNHKSDLLKVEDLLKIIEQNKKNKK